MNLITNCVRTIPRPTKPSSTHGSPVHPVPTTFDSTKTWILSCPTLRLWFRLAWHAFMLGKHFSRRIIVNAVQGRTGDGCSYGMKSQASSYSVYTTKSFDFSSGTWACNLYIICICECVLYPCICGISYVIMSHGGIYSMNKSPLPDIIYL